MDLSCNLKLVPNHAFLFVLLAAFTGSVSIATKHLRFNDLNDPETIPRDTAYALLIESSVPIVVQHTRLEFTKSKYRAVKHDRFQS